MTREASPAAEELHAPRATPGVCADTGVSNELYISFVFGQHGRVFTSGLAPENPPKRDLVVKVLDQVYQHCLDFY